MPVRCFLFTTRQHRCLLCVNVSAANILCLRLCMKSVCMWMYATLLEAYRNLRGGMSVNVCVTTSSSSNIKAICCFSGRRPNMDDSWEGAENLAEPTFKSMQANTS